VKNEERVGRPTIVDAMASLAAALSPGMAPAVELLVRSAREWTGAEYALLVAFGPGTPATRAASSGPPGSTPASVLADPELELAARGGAIVQHTGDGSSILAVPMYAGGDVAGALEVGSTQPGGLTDGAIPALQVLAGIAAAVLEPVGPGRAPGPGLAPHYHSLHDPLTGLPGRALLFDRLHQAIQLARREDAPLAVLVIALTHFGGLADRLGPESGQIILQEFARRTRATLRASDTVARVDEEHLTVLLPGANAIGALGAVKKILRSVGEPFPVAGQHVSFQASAGIAIFPEHGEETEVLLNRAAEALREARAAGLPTHTYGE
jgi:diguanylate cyclase (GGDEF)-like protein